MKHCLMLIEEMKQNCDCNYEINDFYENLIRKVEKYMCSLLDQVDV